MHAVGQELENKADQLITPWLREKSTKTSSTETVPHKETALQQVMADWSSISKDMVILETSHPAVCEHENEVRLGAYLLKLFLLL